MEPSRPQVSVRSGPSLVWIIPLLTALVGGWLVVKTLREQGPEVTISFKTADGIEVGKTRAKYKNLDIGIVERIRFSEDISNVIVTVKFNQGTEEFFRRNTRFWVVRPQLSLRGASGLSTLISGSYIEIEPGKGAPQLHFTGLEEQPVDVVVAALDLPPNGSSALLAAMRRRPEWEAIPVLALADSAEQVQARASQPMGFQDCQAKFDREAMLESVARLASALAPAGTAPVCVGEER